MMDIIKVQFFKIQDNPNDALMRAITQLSVDSKDVGPQQAIVVRNL
jgi:hypothetical protein